MPAPPALAVWGRRLGLGAKVVALMAILLVWAGNQWLVNNTEAYLYTNWSKLPDNDVGLVLGTSPFTAEGKPNAHFQNRIAAAAELYQLGKVRHLILSGANPDARYNEPRKMQQALMALGVPAQAMTLDGGGTRTFDSVARARGIYQLDRVTIITQDYHAYRALFIAKKIGMHPVAYAPVGEESGPAFRPYLREVFARVWAIFDLFLLDTQPAASGEPEPLRL
jgi:SanA protein